jgi:hypothetical protein
MTVALARALIEYIHVHHHQGTRCNNKARAKHDETTKRFVLIEIAREIEK